MNVLRSISCVMALLVAGCANLAPDHMPPKPAAPQSWPTKLQPDGTIVVSTLAWEDYFNDPRLRALIASALASNRDLMAATARVEQARAQYRIEDSNRLPKVVADGDATRSRSSVLGANGETVSATSNRFDIGVGLSVFELDFWGRVANLSEAARANYLATEAAQRAFYLSLISDVATTYFEIIETDQQINLAEATTQSRRDALRIAALRLDAGVTSGLPFRQAESLLTQAEQQLAVERQSSATLHNRLAVLVGGKIPEDLPPGLTLREQMSADRLEAGLGSELLLVRPDIIAAEEDLRAARANIGAARAAFFPTISLTGSAGFASNELDGLFGSDGFGWSFGPSIKLPIFDWGAREANLNLAEAREVEEVANYDATVQNAFREVADALAGRRWLAEQLAAQQRNIAALEQIARIASLRYREGVADYLEVLDAERNLFAARQQILVTARAYRQNAAMLYVALGGGMASNTISD